MIQQAPPLTTKPFASAQTLTSNLNSTPGASARAHRGVVARAASTRGMLTIRFIIWAPVNGQYAGGMAAPRVLANVTRQLIVGRCAGQINSRKSKNIKNLYQDWCEATPD